MNKKMAIMGLLIITLILAGCTGTPSAGEQKQGLKTLEDPLPELPEIDDANIDFGLEGISNPIPDTISTGN